MIKYGNAIYAFREWVIRNNLLLFGDYSSDTVFRLEDYKFGVKVSKKNLDVIMESFDVILFGIPLDSIKVAGFTRIDKGMTERAETEVELKIRQNFKVINRSETHLILFRYLVSNKALDVLYDSKVSGARRIRDVDLLDFTKYKEWGNLPTFFDFPRYLEVSFKS